MKKYMMFVLFVFCQSYAMEQVCYLNRMPADVLNLIASFLMETDEQFIARTQGNKQRLDLFADKKILETFYDDGSDEWLWMHLQCFENDSHMHRLSMMQEGDDRICYDGALEPAEYECIALFGTRMALFYQKKIENTMKPVLELQRIELEKNEDKYKGIINLRGKRELFPLSVKPRWIGFNKQGTHLIAHGKDLITEKDTHQIFPLKKIDPDKPQMLVKITNKLQEYLIDKCVCKYIEGTK